MTLSHKPPSDVVWNTGNRIMHIPQATAGWEMILFKKKQRAGEFGAFPC